MHTRPQGKVEEPRAITEKAMGDIQKLLALRKTPQYYEVMNIVERKHKLSRQEVEAVIAELELSAEKENQR